MIATCGVCGNVLVVTTRRDRPEYQCRRPGCVRIRQTDLDELATDVMLGYLARPDVYEDLRRGVEDSEELATIRAAIAATQQRLDELADALARGGISVSTAARAEPGILAQLGTLRETERALSTPATLTGLVEPGADVARRWRTLPVSARREVARLLLSPDLLGTLAVLRRPVGSGGHVPARERVEWRH